jgi:SAM-dependent methyltransferase
MSESLPEQRFTFDAVAAQYDRARPGYPAALIDAALRLAAIPDGGEILEIGCGTGQLTRELALRGYRIVGLEPGQSLCALARERLAAFPRVEMLQLTFEAWPLEKACFDLVVSAQAFHWIDPALRFGKAADALRPGGALAVIGNNVSSETIRPALDVAYRTHAPSMAGKSPMDWYAATGPLPRLFQESTRFEPSVHRAEPWTRRYTADAYLDLLGTHSDHRLLPGASRESLYAAIRAAIERAGGTLGVQYEAHLHLAQRIG